MRVLVDADVFAYSCGFASQKTVYFTQEPDVVAEPVDHALRLCKNALTGIYEEVDTWLSKSGESASPLELFMTGKDNFRDKLATIREYKGHRKGKPKPVHYQAIRDYMVDVWSAVVVDGYEADDAVAIEAHNAGYDPDKIMICSVDKDLLTVPGLLYSFKRKEQMLISEAQALTSFYRQCVTGDSSDNIAGCYKAGEKAASEITEDMSELYMWQYVLELFDKSVEKKGCPYPYPFAAALETASLLWLLRYPKQIWSPPCP